MAKPYAEFGWTLAGRGDGWSLLVTLVNPQVPCCCFASLRLRVVVHTHSEKGSGAWCFSFPNAASRRWCDGLSCNAWSCMVACMV